jgi:hypothetical protein
LDHNTPKAAARTAELRRRRSELDSLRSMLRNLPSSGSADVRHGQSSGIAGLGGGGDGRLNWERRTLDVQSAVPVASTSYSSTPRAASPNPGALFGNGYAPTYASEYGGGGGGPSIYQQKPTHQRPPPPQVGLHVERAQPPPDPAAHHRCRVCGSSPVTIFSPLSLSFGRRRSLGSTPRPSTSPPPCPISRINKIPRCAPLWTPCPSRSTARGR